MRAKFLHQTFAITACLLFAIGTPALTQTAVQAVPANESSDPLADVDHETVLARVGEMEITLGEVIAHRQTLPDQFQQLPDEVLLESILSQMIDHTLLKQAAQDAGLDRETAFRIALLNTHREVMARAFLARAAQQAVSEEALAEAYAAQFTDQPAVPEVRSSHILIEDKSFADEIKAQLDAGADFASLAEKYSSDATASRGGDRGWLAYADMVPEYGDTVNGMSTGEIVGPVETPFGWHIIRVDGKRDRPVPSLAEVEPMLIAEIRKRVERETLETLRNAVSVKRLTDDVPAQAVRADALIQD